jgi:hypothetical protein
MIFCFFVIMATMRLLNIDAKKWSMDGGRDPSIHRRWHLAFHLEMGALRPPVVTFAEGRVLAGGGAVSQAVPSLMYSL